MAEENIKGNKEIRLVLNPQEQNQLEKAKDFFNEKTRVKVFRKVLDNFIKRQGL